MGDYANRLGASSTEMGWFQSASNLSNNVMQVFWGRLSDRLGYFIKYCYIAGFSEFFMSFAWPLLPITRMTILNGAMFHVALMTVVGSIVTIIFQRWAGRLADRIGRKPLQVSYRLGLVSVPIAYAFSPNIETLIVINAFWGVITALGQVALTAYLLDVSPQDYRGSSIALFNLTIGVVTFFGSLIGGYLSDYMTSLFGNLVIGLQIVYIISTVGRVIGVALHMRLPETLKMKN
jgi:MFS family permease